MPFTEQEIREQEEKNPPVNLSVPLSVQQILAAIKFKKECKNVEDLLQEKNEIEKRIKRWLKSNPVKRRQAFFSKHDFLQPAFQFLRLIVDYDRDQSRWLPQYTKLRTPVINVTYIPHTCSEAAFYRQAEDKAAADLRSQTSEKAVAHARAESVRLFRKRIRQRQNRTSKKKVYADK